MNFMSRLSEGFPQELCIYAQREFAWGYAPGELSLCGIQFSTSGIIRTRRR